MERIRFGLGDLMLATALIGLALAAFRLHPGLGCVTLVFLGLTTDRAVRLNRLRWRRCGDRSRVVGLMVWIESAGYALILMFVLFLEVIALLFPFALLILIIGPNPFGLIVLLVSFVTGGIALAWITLRTFRRSFFPSSAAVNIGRWDRLDPNGIRWMGEVRLNPGAVRSAPAVRPAAESSPDAILFLDDPEPGPAGAGLRGT